jgi:hypothetical protein
MLFSLALLALLAASTGASALPADVSDQGWFDHCKQLGGERLSHFPSVNGYRITYAWQSETGYMWDWENGNHAGDSAHYCVRLALYDKQGTPIEDITLLCSVTGRDKNTETWTFGNREVAERLCPVDPVQLAEMDKRARRRLTQARK